MLPIFKVRALPVTRCGLVSIRQASRTSEPSPKASISIPPNRSQVQTKLEYFVNTGQIIKTTPQKLSRKLRPSKYRDAYSPQKALLMLRARYDPNAFQDSEGNAMRLRSLNANDLKVSSPKSLDIFRNLEHIRKTSKKSVDKRLMLTLLGTNETQLKDPYLVSSDVLKLLERDGDSVRAMTLIRYAAANNPLAGIVGMNIILQWTLERGNTKQALKCLNDRKKWNIPLNSHTYIILFNGLCTSHEWGKVSDELCEEIIAIFEAYRQLPKQSLKNGDDLGRCGIEHFNALLSFVVKNFSDEQHFAWSVFDTLIVSPTTKGPTLVPNSQTFTIFLNGIKKYHQSIAQAIIDNKKLANKDKLARLLENQAHLVETANMILEKVLQSALPPRPPTKEEAEQDPEVLVQYRMKMNRILLTIDHNFVSVFVSCYINGFSGTGTDFHAGSHYSYIRQGLEYLKIWSPEMHKLMDAGGKNATQPSKHVKHVTDTRTNQLLDTESGKQLVEALALPELDGEKINPMVIFPPSPFSKNKTRAIFSNKLKPLVDLTRLTYDEVQMILQDKSYRDSRGKFGKKMPSHINISKNTKKHELNKFLIMNYLDGLVSLGRTKEFVTGMWNVYDRWGGLHIKDSELEKVLKGNSMFDSERVPEFLGPKPVENAVNRAHNDTVVDILLVENFIFKLNDKFKQKGTSAIETIVDVFTALVSPHINVSQSLRPRAKTAHAIFSSFMTDLHYYNDYTYNQLAMNTTKDKASKAIPHKSVSKHQLGIFLPALARFMDALLVFESQHTSQNRYLLPNMYLDSYNRIVERVVGTTWVDTSPEDKVRFHKYIIRSGILMYQPQSFVDPREKLSNAAILRSLQVVYEWFKQNKGLSKDDVRLGSSIKSLFQLRKTDVDADKKLQSILKSIYRHSDPKLHPLAPLPK